MFGSCIWHNEPREWSVNGGELTVRSDERTDFWRDTHYGFTRDSGHFFGRAWEGDFTASLRVQGRYEELYDQAGIMVRIDGSRWIKAGIELSDGAACVGSVLTVNQSDWSTSVYASDPSDSRHRASRGTASAIVDRRSPLAIATSLSISNRAHLLRGADALHAGAEWTGCNVLEVRDRPAQW